MTADFDEYDPLVDDAWDTEAFPPPRGITMRSPILLLLVLMGSVFMMMKYWPRVAYMIQAQEPADCGSISERPILRSEDASDLPPLTHNSYCRVQGTVQNFTILATGEPKVGKTEVERNAGRKYFVKLDGDKIFSVFGAERPDVIRFRGRHGSLLGFEMNENGRMIDPDADKGYAATARILRLKFGVEDNTPIRIFDTTDTPERWGALVGIIFLALTSLLALLGLFRYGRRWQARRSNDAAA